MTWHQPADLKFCASRRAFLQAGGDDMHHNAGATVRHGDIGKAMSPPRAVLT